ncbi:MAG: efflux RND transporter periplasmic adaptor subunit, partial [Chitinophagales bacterium]|nr:efflux RND transporter periplasmic adaptor subunit [Chitinophagales bacterium]
AKSIIKAPFAGKIGLRNISAGSYITPSVLIANLVNTSKVKITFSIPEKYANSIKMGTSIQFNTSSTQSNSLAKIYAIEPEIDINTRTLLVRAIAENSNGSLMPGTFANIMLPLQTIPDAIIIPSESVIPIQGGKKVFIAENGNAKEVKVETSTRTDASILIIKGLNKGDTLITSGIMSLKDKAPVKIKLK